MNLSVINLFFGEKMKKLKEFIIKHDNMCFIVLITIIISGIALDVYLTPLSDEIWNFQNVYKMYNGLKIYQEANVIITPLFFYIGEVLFKILGANFFTFRIYNILINVFLYFMIYLIYKELIKSKLRSYMYSILTFVICSVTVTTMSNYNSFATTLFLLGTFINLKKEKNPILNGIIIFLIFMSKQNMGVYYIMALVLKAIYVDKFNKNNIFNLVKQMIVFIILFILYCLYLYVNSNLYNFISYCFLGIGEFKNNIKIEIDFILVTAVIIITIFILKKILLKKGVEINKDIKIIECFFPMLLLIGYPIFNESHIGIGSVLMYVELLILLDNLFLSELMSQKLIINFIVILFLVLAGISLYHLNSYFNILKTHNFEFKIYYGAILEEEVIDDVKQIVRFKEENDKKTIVFGNRAAFYNIVTNESYGAMDLPFLGNFGAKGENGMIEQLKNLKNTDVLLEKNEKELCYQESFKIRDWIKENLKLVGEIGRYYIYETE